MNITLTERILTASLHCTTKCYLLLKGRHGIKSEYERHVDQFDAQYHRAGLAALSVQYPRHATLRLNNLSRPTFDDRVRLVTIDSIEINQLKLDRLILLRSQNGYLHPIVFHRPEELSLKAKLLLAFRCILVSQAIGITPTYGLIIHGRSFKSSTIRSSTLIPKLDACVNRITDLAIKDTEPELLLCSHCEICEFQKRCRSRAVELDSLSLLEGIGRTQIDEQRKRGIFTLHQYSHTFRSRRASKRAKKLAAPRHFALQARALRDNKVFIHGAPKIPSAPICIFIDFEGIPEHRLHYLFGALIVSEQSETYQSFWADSADDQIAAFSKLCDCLSRYHNAALFHYGSYEVKVLNKMKQLCSVEPIISDIIQSSHNLLSLIHHHYYLPTYSNR
jgi:predicted RecB family nuclease